MDIDENENISNINIIDDERDIIDITVPSLPIKSNRMNQYAERALCRRSTFCRRFPV